MVKMLKEVFRLVWLHFRRIFHSSM